MDIRQSLTNVASGVADAGTDLAIAGIRQISENAANAITNIKNLAKQSVTPESYGKDIRASVLQMRSKKSVYTIANNDYKWQPAYDTINTIDGTNPPKLVVRELQTIEAGDWRAVSGGILKAVGNLLPTGKGSKDGGSSSSGKGGMGGLGALGSIAGPLLIEASKQGTEVLLRNPELCKSGFDLATKYMDRLVEYSTVKVFELPYFEQDMFSSSGGEWALDGSNSGPLDSTVTTQTFSINTPMPPTWKGSNANQRGVRTSFNLINFTSMTNSTDQLVKNYKFMLDLLAGSYWMQVYLFQKSSNLYSIECPGRFFIPYAQMNVDAKFFGKTRTNEEAISLLHADGILNGYEYTDILFPDMYTIDITFEPKSISNLNTFVQSQNKNTIIFNNSTSAGTDYGSEIGSYHDRLTSDVLYSFGATGE